MRTYERDLTSGGAARVTPPTSFWLDGLDAPATTPAEGEVRADILIIGGGYTGLWTALALREADPALRVVLCEAETIGFGASGRNGGFCEPSLTHGLANGLRHYPDEVAELEALGASNHAAMLQFIEANDIDCDLETTGMLDLAVAGWQVDELAEMAELHTAFGQRVELLPGSAARERVHSPMVVGGLARPDDGAVLHPGKLALGLRRVALERGVVIHERTPVTGLRVEGSGADVDRVSTGGVGTRRSDPGGSAAAGSAVGGMTGGGMTGGRSTGSRSTHRSGVIADVPGGVVRADRVVVATNAYSADVLRPTRRHFVPVHDHVLVSDPLSPAQMTSIGWEGREGLADAGNQFHYFRLTADDRILWGGYDAIYRYGGALEEDPDEVRTVQRRLEAHFAQMFPQLADLAFPYRWSGPIATTTRFTPVFGEALGGRVIYALGYTGLGVAATRFAGQVLAATLTDPSSALLRLRYTSSTPFPFPPEPVRWAGVQLVRRAIGRSDRLGGRRGPLLGALDRLGIGFDS